MKCPICDGELVQKQDSLKLGADSVAYSVFECGQCGEELVFEDEAKRVFHEAAEFKRRLRFVKSIGYSGNSLVLRIPAKLAEGIGLRKGTKTEIIAQDKGFYVGLHKSA